MKNRYNTEEFRFLKSLKSVNDIYGQICRIKKGERCTYESSKVVEYTDAQKLIDRNFHDVTLDLIDGIRKEKSVIEHPYAFCDSYRRCVIEMEKIMFDNKLEEMEHKIFTNVYEIYVYLKKPHQGMNITDVLSFEDCIRMKKEEMKKKVRDFLLERGAYECKFDENGKICSVLKNSVFASIARRTFNEIDEMYETQIF